MENTLLQLSNRLPYNPNLKEKTRELRKNMTEPEKKLWYGFLRGLQDRLPLNPPQLRGKADEGSRGRLRVYRQRPVAHFIVDFYIPALKLVIEVDGESHFTDEGIVYDKERTEILNSLWLSVYDLQIPMLWRILNECVKRY
jgi:very-short-patch-repair endonuclease